MNAHVIDAIKDYKNRLFVKLESREIPVMVYEFYIDLADKKIQKEMLRTLGR